MLANEFKDAANGAAVAQKAGGTSSLTRLLNNPGGASARPVPATGPAIAREPAATPMPTPVGSAPSRPWMVPLACVPRPGADGSLPATPMAQSYNQSLTSLGPSPAASLGSSPCSYSDRRFANSFEREAFLARLEPTARLGCARSPRVRRAMMEASGFVWNGSVLADESSRSFSLFGPGGAASRAAPPDDSDDSDGDDGNFDAVAIHDITL